MSDDTGSKMDHAGSVDTPPKEVAPSSSALENQTNGEKGDEPQKSPRPPHLHGFLWFITVSAILSASTLFALDNTVVAAVQSPIVRQFDSLDRLPWLSVGYLIGSTATVLFWGQVYNNFDTKWTFCACVLLFEVGSAVCGAAPNMNALIVGRVICGWGGAGLYTGAITLLSVNSTDKERPQNIGLTGISWGVGTCLGPIIGGAFSESSATWRWSFYINLCVGAVVGPIYIGLIPRNDPCPDRPLRQRITSIDWFGSLLLCGFSLAGFMAISFGGQVYAWDSGSIIALFVVFGVLIIAFTAQQLLNIGTTEETRLFPYQVFKYPFQVSMYWQVAAAATTTFVPIYFIPLYFSFVKGDDALQSGVRLLPYVVPMVVICVINGYSMSYFGYYNPWFIFGGVCTTAGCAALYTISQYTDAANIYGYSVLVGFGSGAFVQAPYAVAMAKAKPELVARVVGFLAHAQQAGPGFALAIANAVFLNLGEQSVSKIVPQYNSQEVQGIISGASTELIGQLDPNTKNQVLGAIVQAMDKTFLIPMICGAISLILSLTYKWERIF